VDDGQVTTQFESISRFRESDRGVEPVESVGDYHHIEGLRWQRPILEGPSHHSCLWERSKLLAGVTVQVPVVS
jgi:hypothetical protein